jgi:hypothetical protein
MDEYLALPDGAGRFRQDFSGPVLLRNSAVLLALRLRDFHPLWCRFPDGFDFSSQITTPLNGAMRLLQPRWSLNSTGLGYSPFARHYLGNHTSRFASGLVVFSSSGYLDVSVPRVRLMRLCIQRTMMPNYRHRVFPFGHLRINGRLHLPAAFRSLPRPSSPVHAQASTMSPYLLIQCQILHENLPMLAR